jgi:hypothetical protein
LNYSTMREIILLKKLQKHERFVQMLDLIQEKDIPTKPIHCVFEYCETTMARFLKARIMSMKGPLPVEEVKR